VKTPKLGSDLAEYGWVSQRRHGKNERFIVFLNSPGRAVGNHSRTNLQVGNGLEDRELMLRVVEGRDVLSVNSKKHSFVCNGVGSDIGQGDLVELVGETFHQLFNFDLFFV
jgi:hypothetical protein